MTKSVKEDQWVWVVLQDPGGNEQFLGQYDEEQKMSFIPTFLKKEEALQCLNLLAKDSGQKYEVQAIRYWDLAHQASDNKFMIFVLSGDGNVVEKIQP